MALNKTYWQYSSAHTEDWGTYGIKYADKQIYANPNFSWGNLDLSFPTSFRKGKVTKIYTVTSSTAQNAVTVNDCIIYNSMVRFSGSGNYGSFYKDNILSYYSAGNEGYYPVIDIDTHEFAYKMTVRLFTSGNWVTVNAVDFVNNYDNYDAGVYGYINNYMTAGGGGSYGFCNFYDCGNSQFSVKANWNGFRTSGYSSKELGGHVTSGQTWISNRTIWQLATTSGMPNYSTQPASYNMYIPFEIPELQGQTWNAGNGQSAPSALITGGSYTNHVVLSYSDQRVYMPLKHILRDIVVNCGLVLLDSNDDKWISMVDSNGLCQNKLVLMSSDEAKESSIYNTRTSDNNLNPNPPPPIPSGDDYADMGAGAGTGVGGYTSFAIMTKNDLIDLLGDFNANLKTGMSVVNNFVCLYKLGPLASFLCSTSESWIIMSVNASENFVSQRNDYAIVSSQSDVINLGSINVPRMTNTFYDFAPYSTYEMFIPCCGWVALPDTVAGRTVSVIMVIDLASCTCKAMCRIDGTTVAEASGVLGVSVPFFSTDSGLKRVGDVMAVTQIAGGLAQGTVGSGAGSGALIVSGTMDAIRGIENLYINGNTNYTAIRGGNGDITAVGNGEYCTLKITHPVVDEVVNNSTFGHTIGYICNEVGQLKNYSGFTVCGNPHITGISCTEEEKEEIKMLLEQGVILPSGE